jgi:hypothetical protein
VFNTRKTDIKFSKIISGLFIPDPVFGFFPSRIRNTARRYVFNLPSWDSFISMFALQEGKNRVDKRLEDIVNRMFDR